MGNNAAKMTDDPYTRILCTVKGIWYQKKRFMYGTCILLLLFLFYLPVEDCSYLSCWFEACYFFDILHFKRCQFYCLFLELSHYWSTKWVEEVRRFCHRSNFVLCGFIIELKKYQRGEENVVCLTLMSKVYIGGFLSACDNCRCGQLPAISKKKIHFIFQDGWLSSFSFTHWARWTQMLTSLESAIHALANEVWIITVGQWGLWPKPSK